MVPGVAEHYNMTQCIHPPSFSKRRNRWQDKRVRQLKKLANMRAAKERKRLANPPEREPEFVRYFPLEFGVRDKRTGETVWMDLRSTRDAAKRINAVLKYYA
jgi:hypothetical protein